MDFEYYVEKAFSQHCTLKRVIVGDKTYYTLYSDSTERFSRFGNLHDVDVALNTDFDFQKPERLPRIF